MRSKNQIEKELNETRERCESYQKDEKDYDGRDPAERYLFFTAVKQLINGTSQKISQLEDELKQYDTTNSTSTP